MRNPPTILSIIALQFLASCGGSNPTTTGDADINIDAPSEPTVLELPVRLHVLQSDEIELNAQLSDNDAVAMVASVNETWSIGAIKFEIDEIRRPTVIDATDYLAAAESGEKSPAGLAALGTVVPEGDLLAPGWNVVVTQSMLNLPPGVYLVAKLTVLVAMETPGGPLHPNTLAHELGHSLGLPHVDGSDSFNLMASGPGTAPAKDRNELSDAQIATAREQALTGAPASSAAAR